MLRRIFELHFCTCTVHFTRLNRTVIYIHGPFSYFRELLIPAGEPFTSPCHHTIINPHDLSQPLKPLAGFYVPKDRLAHPQDVSLAA